MNKMMRNIVILIVIIILIIVLSDALYIVSETNQVIITQFGEPIGGAITSPGLHVKIPFIQKAHYFEKRWLEWDGDANQIPTKDKKYIWVDTYARWRISDPLKFFQRVKDERGAQSRLDDIIDGETRNAVANFDLIEIVRSTNREFELTEESAILDIKRAIPKIKTGREKIAKLILERASKITPEFGVELKDVRFKRVNYVEEVQKKVFDRMIAERKRIAAKYRSEGDGRSAEIRGQKERELKRILSEAYRKVQEIKGKADAEAIRIYAKAYNLDPEFYQFMKTLEIYKNTLKDNTWLLLSTDSEFLKYLKSTKRK
ncbi:protease modulator HflC [Candidatus Aminicenantes bacterium AC-335-B20]|jgi:membrane protease subunit HflC|nr:protease modulator HflC [SCandidatus Aminicenantes bacterium Aminicenantia_JdfR_composite]MCP2597430.1 protease modulator HflC [Candidatus Aminicenantes bacterium AC-335-G13]MCP2599232.1 protease modulator HflC [Candidatus Aminicenantes bacterium AC-335-B20]MCP2620744.1 protease modulator HflC [Candidatus Aminicenantes bacterium AC-334-E05]